MPLNYSKWDQLELSDDSDIEEHPNVDKKSMIRWRQRDIHEKREQRKQKIAKLHSELSLNTTLRPRIQSIADGVSSKGVDYYRSVQRRIRESPSDEKPATGAANQPTYDMMIGQLLGDVFREGCWIMEGAKVSQPQGKVIKDGKVVDEKSGEPSWATGEIPENKKDGLKIVLEERLAWHLAELDKRDKQVKAEIEVEEREHKKKITSEDMTEGWDTSSITKAKPSVIDDKPKTAPKKEKAKAKEETIEVLNPGSASSSTPTAPTDPEEEEDLPDFGPLTPAARQFVQIPIGDFQKSYAFIQKDSSVLSESSHDSLLAEAFDAERRGDKGLAQRCVHQSLLVNYCRQLGRDGVGLFFQKMIAQNPKSITMFNEDFARTYNRIASRTIEILAEEAASGQGADGSGEVEQIQLVAEDPNVKIGFNLPDGPPPADLRVEGEGAEEMDIEQVRAFLQRKWDIFQQFPDKLREALQTESLDEVNKVLGRMKVAEAENIVELMQEGGMLSFSENGVRDMTS